MTTGERIKQLRLERNLSQEELGAKVGVQKSAINKYETGVVINLKRGMIAKLADALGVTPAYMMGWEDDQSANDLTLDELSIIKSYRSVSEQGKRYIREQVDIATKLYTGDAGISDLEKVK